MEYSEILKIQVPYEAVAAMAQKVRGENLSIHDMEKMVEHYAKYHGLEVDELLRYANET